MSATEKEENEKEMIEKEERMELARVLKATISKPSKKPRRQVSPPMRISLAGPFFDPA